MPGDELLEIQGKAVQEMTAKEAKRAMRERPLLLFFHRSEEPASASSSAPASPPPKPRKSKAPETPDDVLSQARKSLAAILPDGMNPLQNTASASSPSARKSKRAETAEGLRTSKVVFQEEAAEEDGWDDDDDDWNQPVAQKGTKGKKDAKASDKKSDKKGKDGKEKPKQGKPESDKSDKKEKEKEREKAKEKPKEKGKEREKAKEAPKEKEKKEEAPPPLLCFASASDVRLGFKVDWPPNPTYVSKVDRNSWAEMAQVEVGLRLDKAGGKDVAKMSKEKLKKILDETRPLELAFVKDKKKKKPPSAKPENESILGGMFG